MAPPHSEPLDPRLAAERFRALVEHSVDVIMLLSPRGELLYASQAAQDVLGYAAGENIGRATFELVHPEDLPRVQHLFRTLLTERAGPLRAEFRVRHKAGAWRYLEATGVNRLDDPAVRAVVITYRDVTARKQAEDAQQAAYRIAEAVLTTDSLNALFASIHRILGAVMPVPNFYIALYDAASGTLSFPYFHDAHEPAPPPRQLGRGLTEYVLRTGQPALVTPEQQLELERRGEVELLGAPSLDWLGIPLKHGATTIGVLATQSYTETIRFGAREQAILQFVSALVALAIERRRAEQALQQSEANYRLLIEQAPDAIIIADADGRFLDANSKACELTGYPRAELLQLAMEATYPSDERHAAAARRHAFRHGSRFWPERRLRRKDGSERIVEVSAAPLSDGRVHAVFRDVTERRRAEETLQATQTLLQSVLDHAPIVLWAADQHGVLTLARGRGLEDPRLATRHVVGQSALELHRTIRFLDAQGRETDGSAAIARALAGEPVTGVGEVDGTYLENVLTPLRTAARELHGMVGVSLVVTERKRLEEQLRQAQKMEAIGQFAAGIAHDFNNIVTAISGYASLLLEDLHGADPRRADVDEIQQAALRAAGLTRQLLAFSRKQVLEPRVVRLGDIVENLLPLLRRMIGEHIALTTDLAPDPWAVFADPGQLEQVLLNLAVNSRDAMPAGGAVTITTRDVHVTEPAEHAKFVVPAGRYAMLAVADTGSGMTPEVSARIFEPFFTTKPQGQGTGLGLSTVYGIVKQSGGYVWVSSTPGQGTTFTIYLPRVEAAAASAAIPPHSPDDAPLAALRGLETILVVEDQDSVRALTRRVLEAYGYRVLVAADGVEALRVAEAYAGPIHLLVSDVIMPGMSGREVGLLLQALRPELKTLYLSGYPGESIVHHGVLEPGVAFLQKPFAPEALARKVRDELDGRGSPESPPPGT